MVVKIYLTLIFRGISKSESALHPKNALFIQSTLFISVQASFLKRPENYTGPKSHS